MLNSTIENGSSQEPGSNVSSAIRKAAALIVLGVGSLLSGCGAPTVWKAEIPSPDGHWLAIAQTIQNGGFGTGSIFTTVLLKQANLWQRPTEVLVFSCEGPVPRPYVLDNAANAGGTINLKMEWVTPSHLEVTYSGQADLYFQAFSYSGIEISVRDLSGKTASASH
jgi:hypothetical protein